MDQSGDGSVLSERSVVGGTQSQVSDEANDGLDQRPSAGRMHQPDNNGEEAALDPDSVLSKVTLLVSTGQVSEGAHSWHCDLSFPGSNNGPDQSPDAAYSQLVLLVVAGQQVGEDAGCTGHNVDIGGVEELHQTLHKIVRVLLLGAIIISAF